MAIVIFALSVNVCEIFVKQEKLRKCDLENEVKCQGVEERNLRHSTANIRFHMGEIPEF